MDYVYLTTAEVGAIIRKSPDWVASQCRKGDLKAKKLGDTWRIHSDDLTSYIRNGPTRVVARRRRAR